MEWAMAANIQCETGMEFWSCCTLPAEQSPMPCGGFQATLAIRQASVSVSPLTLLDGHSGAHMQHLYSILFLSFNSLTWVPANSDLGISLFATISKRDPERLSAFSVS